MRLGILHRGENGLALAVISAQWSGKSVESNLHDYRLVYQARSLSRSRKLVVGKQVPNFRKIKLDRLDLGHGTVRLSHKVGCRAGTPLFGVLSHGGRG